jgi:hypothetical protein
VHKIRKPERRRIGDNESGEADAVAKRIDRDRIHLHQKSGPFLESARENRRQKINPRRDDDRPEDDQKQNKFQQCASPAGTGKARGVFHANPIN